MGSVIETEVPIDEMVGLLAKYSPKSLLDLKDKFPLHEDLLRPGIWAGNPQPADLLVRLEVCLAALQTATQVCQKAMDKIGVRLRKARSFNVLGQTLTLVAGASIFGVLAVDTPKTAKYLAGVIALLGSMFTFIGRQLELAPLARNRSLFDIFPELARDYAQAESLMNELKLAQRLGGDRQTVQTVRNANMLAANIAKAVAQTRV